MQITSDGYLELPRAFRCYHRLTGMLSEGSGPCYELLLSDSYLPNHPAKIAEPVSLLLGLSVQAGYLGPNYGAARVYALRSKWRCDL